MRRFIYLAVAAATLLLAGGGYALASGVLQPATIYGCVQNGSIHNVSVTKAPTCPSGAYAIQWPGEAAVSASPSPTPTPTPTGGGGGTASCSASSATWTSSSATGSEGVTDGSIYDSSQYSTYVNQDVWNQVNGWQQAMYACGGSDWTVTANMPAGNTAVVSYPDIQQIYGSNGDPAPLSSLPGLTSTFSVTDPGDGPGDHYEAAYDIWAGSAGSSWSQEVMVWEDNHGQDLGWDTKLGTAVIDGESYTIYRNGSSVGDELIVSHDTNQTSGTVPLGDILSYLSGQGFMTADGINAVDFGYELSSTGGTTQTFALNSYTLSISS